MGNGRLSFQGAVENLNEPGSHHLKGAVLKLFQSILLLLTIRYAPSAMRFAEVSERGFKKNV
jgi:hypothetical protein